MSDMFGNHFVVFPRGGSNIDFSNTQGQITRRSEVGSGRNSNSSEMLWMSVLFSRIKKIQIKMKALEWQKQYILIFHTVKGR